MSNRFRISPLWTPDILPLAAWFDAQDYSTIIESGTVSQWTDKTGSGNNASEATGADQPSYNAIDSRMNNLPSRGFDGDVLKRLTTPSFSFKEMYIIAYYDNATFGSWDIMVGKSDNRFGGWSGANYFQDNNSATTYKNGSYTTNYADNTGKPPVLPMTITLWDNTWDSLATGVWRIFNAGQSWQRWGRHGAIGEIIMTDGLESASDRNKIEGYLAWKWGIVSSLPVGHPYKNSRPTI